MSAPPLWCAKGGFDSALCALPTAQGYRAPFASARAVSFENMSTSVTPLHVCTAIS
jgi:hypothetical protein